MRTLALGLMSGTSMDGIDTAIIDVNTHALIAGQTIAYPPQLATQLTEVMHGARFDMRFYAQLNKEVGRAFATAAAEVLATVSEPLFVLGSHGQTLCHQPTGPIPYTWQIGCPFTIYEQLKVPVVYDFRSHNLAQGGQGAPLAPLYHQRVFAPEKNYAVVNIGGITNISVCKENGPVIGYDIGPGNCLSDAWIATKYAVKYDKNGQLAATGQVVPQLLDALLQDKFFHQAYPKSIGKEYFSLQWLLNHTECQYLLHQDVQASIIALTAQLIATEIKKHLLPANSGFICGGGVKNKTLLANISQLLPDYNVASTDARGISSDYLEAMMIAWLAWCRITNKKHHVASVLGGNDEQLLGIICQ